MVKSAATNPPLHKALLFFKSALECPRDLTFSHRELIAIKVASSIDCMTPV